jgi:uridylate kinase
VEPTRPDHPDHPAVFERVLIKLSGEALMGNLEYGTDRDRVRAVAEQVADVQRRGVEVAIVVGGGNIYRGLAAAAAGMDRATGDYMGMLATVLNALALQDALEKQDVATRVQSAITISEVAEPYIRRRAMRHLEKGRIVIFAAGTGNPFFTTDTGAALRAAELSCDAVMKATQVDGIYSADPKKDPTATRFDRLSHDEAIARNLQVMDTAAFALARDNGIPIVVFSIHEPGAIPSALVGKGRATYVMP